MYWPRARKGRTGRLTLELQAAICLARLWQSKGKRQGVRDLLALIYNWFTEGFDTKDLIEAKELLNQLQ